MTFRGIHMILQRLRCQCNKKAGDDKRKRTGHDFPMRVVCPRCRAAYRLGPVDADLLLVCHRCGAEFRPDQDDAPAHLIDEETQPAAAAAEESPLPQGQEAPAADPGAGPMPGALEDHTGGEQNPPLEETVPVPNPILDTANPAMPPGPAKRSILPWLLAVVLALAAAGLLINSGGRSDDLWLRSVLINLGVPLAVRDGDWRIPPESVHARWIVRNDGREVLLIEGRVKNRLQCELPPPSIRVSIFTHGVPERLLLVRIKPIAQPPLVEAAVQRASLLPPPDRSPIAPLGERDFALVMQDLPEEAGDFALAPVVTAAD